MDKDSLIDACLAHIPFDGWSDEALSAAAQDLGCAADSWRELFPGGVQDAFIHYSEMADKKMVLAFDAWYQAQPSGPVPTHLQIRQLILIRLEQAQPYQEVVRKSLSFLARPEMAPLAPQLLYRTVDDMWRAAGDVSTDYNFYTKRATLSAVYSATLLAFLSDQTTDLSSTTAFLDRRLKDISRIPKMSAPVKAAADGLVSGIRRTAEMMMARRQR